MALEEVILEEDKIYPKPVQSEADFLMLSILSSFALEALSSWALTWNSSVSSFLVFSAKKLFLNFSTSIVWFAFVYLLTSYISFAIIVPRIKIISKWDKHSSSRRSNIKRREIIPQISSIISKFLKAKHFIKLCTGSPLQLSSDLKQLRFKLLGPFSQEIVLKPQCSNSLISFVKLCGELFLI